MVRIAVKYPLLAVFLDIPLSDIILTLSQAVLYYPIYTERLARKQQVLIFKSLV